MFCSNWAIDNRGYQFGLRRMNSLAWSLEYVGSRSCVSEQFFLTPSRQGAINDPITLLLIPSSPLPFVRQRTMAVSPVLTTVRQVGGFDFLDAKRKWLVQGILALLRMRRARASGWVVHPCLYSHRKAVSRGEVDFWQMLMSVDFQERWYNHGMCTDDSKRLPFDAHTIHSKTG